MAMDLEVLGEDVLESVKTKLTNDYDGATDADAEQMAGTFVEVAKTIIQHILDNGETSGGDTIS
jgi:hypothetical protein